MQLNFRLQLVKWH